MERSLLTETRQTKSPLKTKTAHICPRQETAAKKKYGIEFIIKIENISEMMTLGNCTSYHK